MAAPVQGRSSPRWIDAALLVWPALLSVALLWPLLTRPGHPLARDLAFLPQQPLTWSAAGLADGSPRAVPLDAVVALLTTVVDGGILARILLPGILVLAAAGVMRSLPWVGPVGLLVAGGVTVWNPFVVERLALGQWALLTSYAALPWLVRAVAAAPDSTRRRLDRVAPVVGWAALASLTPTGGLLALAVLVVRVASRTRGATVPFLAVLVLQTPWIVAGIVGSAATVSDPAGVAAFAPDTEGAFGSVVALLGLGGVWDSGSEPSSRSTWLAPLTALVAVGALAVAGRELHRRLVAPVTWWMLGLGGLLYALVLTTEPGQAGLRLLVAHVPAAGLLRDAQKFLLPTALLLALAGAAVTDRFVRLLVRTIPDAPEVRLVLVVPVIVVPPAAAAGRRASGVADRRPRAVPESSYAEVDRITAGSGRAVVVLPWRAYRRFAWANGLTSSDPATRALRAPTIVSDDLQVGSQLVRGKACWRPRSATCSTVARHVTSVPWGSAGLSSTRTTRAGSSTSTDCATYEDEVLDARTRSRTPSGRVPPLAGRGRLAAAYALDAALLAAVACAGSPSSCEAPMKACTAGAVVCCAEPVHPEESACRLRCP